MKSREYFELPIERTNVYVYKNQSQFQGIKYPFISIFLDLSWHIGDNIGADILLVSPNTKAHGHTYDSILNAIGHEFVHTVVYRISPRSNLWINEGLALYLSNRRGEGFVLYKGEKIPGRETWYTSNPMEFADNGGYDFADKYIEYIEYAYGKETVLRLIASSDFKDVLKIDDMKLYEDWYRFLVDRYGEEQAAIA
jgi:hypothetical protein